MTPWVKRLIIANTVAFVLTWVLRIVPMEPFAFVPLWFPRQPWSLVTYMFLHGGPMHFLFNMLGLYFLGPRLEDRLGGRQFLWLYFVAGIMAAVVSVMFTAAPIIGASGAVFGVLLGYARYWPRERLYIMGLVPVEVRLLVIVVTIASLFFGFTGSGGNIAHFAHLGGFLGGFLYLKWWDRRSPAARFKAKAQRTVKRSPGGDSADLKRWSGIQREEMHPVNQEELDRILDKINVSGIGSLTADEREFLERFSAR
jgi:membrane associated rhomboid family serine protease